MHLALKSKTCWPAALAAAAEYLMAAAAIVVGLILAWTWGIKTVPWAHAWGHPAITLALLFQTPLPQRFNIVVLAGASCAENGRACGLWQSRSSPECTCGFPDVAGH